MLQLQKIALIVSAIGREPREQCTQTIERTTATETLSTAISDIRMRKAQVVSQKSKGEAVGVCTYPWVLVSGDGTKYR